VITPIGLDHVEILGETLAAIAGEKAGIVKPGVPVVSAAQEAEAEAVVAAAAARQGSTLLRDADVVALAARGPAGALE